MKPKNRVIAIGIAVAVIILGVIMWRKDADSPLDRLMRNDNTASSSRSVVINGQGISDERIADLEAEYGLPVPDGEFWYDPLCGAWGMVGGPAGGVMHPNLALGGPLRADASHGNTGVFINGRQLHMIDVLALQAVYGPNVQRRRIWMDAQGNWGPENGPAWDNVWAAAARAGLGGGGGGGKEGILSGYDKTGIAVYSW